MATLTTETFSIEQFLAQEREKDLQRFSTAGSVDDGKSTLIGRLLYDTQSVYEDQVRSIEGKGTTAPGQIDFALLTDGLRAEREQGITIDVAYRYFSTAKRKFIIADTPGHEQYTRNMATGASTADATVVLIDASKGVLPQSRRHAYIASLLRVAHVLVAVNKMDLVGYSEAIFRAIEKDFRAVLEQIAADTGTAVHVEFIPVSALIGDNVVHRSDAMPWYTGPALLEALETLPAARQEGGLPFRFPVQRVVRPNHTFRGFAGQIASGKVKVGDNIVVLPSGSRASVKRIVTWDGDLEEAEAPLSVTLVLDREVDISRGDVVSAAAAPTALAIQLTASMVWLNAEPLKLNHRYMVKHASHTVPAFVTSVEHRTNIETLAHEPARTLEMNHIGAVHINLWHRLAVDRYAENRTTGAFILINPETNATAAAGMIREITNDAAGIANGENASEPVTARERAARWGHGGGVLELSGSAQLIDIIERSLFAAGAITCRIDALDEALLGPSVLEAIAELQTQAGILSLVTRAGNSSTLLARIEDVEIDVGIDDTLLAVEAVHRLLRRKGILVGQQKGGL